MFTSEKWNQRGFFPAKMSLIDTPNVMLYLIEAKIQKQRLKDMKSAALKRNICISNTFRPGVSHVVTEFTDYAAVLRSLGVQNEKDMEGIEVVSVQWFSDCMRAGKVIRVELRHRLKRNNTSSEQVLLPVDANDSVMRDYSCQRATPLKHHNEKYTNALEVLEKFADLREGDNDYSRALAFRRASCVLKSLPAPLTDIQQLRNITNIGDHSRRVIQELLEDGVCDEVETILRDPWFHKMKLFTGVFGIGPSTAKQFIAKGWSTIQEAQLGYKSADWRVQWGLAFHDDLSTPVLRVEADYIRDLVEQHLTNVLPGGVMSVTGGFRRGKASGHDVDILITHPIENKITGALPRLLQSLESTDTVLCGRLERSTYSDDVLSMNTKLSTRGQLDHFEKWIGMIKVPKKVREEHNLPCENTLHSKSCEKYQTKTDTNCQGGKQNEKIQSEVLYSRLDPASGTGNVADTNGAVDILHNNDNPSSEEDSFDIASLKASNTRGDKRGNGDKLPQDLAAEDRNWLARRVDLIIAPFSQYYYALVGWTGSKQFNRDARLYAERKLNMKLSSHGLYDFTSGRQIPATSEREVFDNLQLPYHQPTDRNC